MAGKPAERNPSVIRNASWAIAWDGKQHVYLLAWQPSSYDSHSPIFNIMSTRAELVPGGKALKGQGSYNPGGYSNPRVDALADVIRVEIDPAKRQSLIDEVFKIHKAEMPQIPLHQQALSWGVKASVDVIQRADDSLELQWVRVN
jgi:peptide/nickel transport system substrate-binding protein